MRHSTAIDLTGQTFSRWTVTARAGVRGCGKAAFSCRCICGGVGIVTGEQLRRGKSKSCGCLRREAAAALCATRAKRLANLVLANQARRTGTKDAMGNTIVGPRHFRLSRPGPKSARCSMGGPARGDIFNAEARATWLERFSREARAITRRHAESP